MRTITIRLDIPDGVDVRFGDPNDGVDEEPLPPPQWPQPDEPVVAIVAGRNGTGVGSCPIHHVPWKTVPAGVSKRSGQPYRSFAVCRAPGCQERPR